MQGDRAGLFADLYQFMMLQSYLEHGLTGEAVFDLHVRRLPPQRGFLVAAGLAQAMKDLEGFRFSQADLTYLQQQGFHDVLLDYLRRFRFQGEVLAIPEGRLAFPYEPLVQVRAPLPMAQLVETVLLNTIHASTLQASKAARCFQAAGRVGGGERPRLVDFGARRAHGRDAALAAARNAYLAGFDGTSLVEASARLGIPCFGTMAHSYILAFPSEEAALEAFARSFPDRTTLLVDTYDTEEGARIAARVAKRLAGNGVVLGGVRLDSGDLGAHARQVRAILDAEGLRDALIIASGGLDEAKVARLLAEGAPIDGFGIGTALVVSEDMPSLDLAYKLAAYEGRPVMKTSEGKLTLPGAKQVWRRSGKRGELAGDTIGTEDEALDGEPLLQPAGTERGRRALELARERFLDEFPRLPAEVRDLEGPKPYEVARSPRLDARTARVRAGHAQEEI